MYDSSFDDEISLPRRQFGRPTNAGLYAGITALVGFGLLGAIALLWILMWNEGNIDGTRLLIWWFVILDFLAFAAGLLALLLGIRAVAPDNLLYRGFGLAGLIGGIVLMLATSLIGFFLFCCGMFLELARIAPGG